MTREDHTASGEAVELSHPRVYGSLSDAHYDVLIRGSGIHPAVVRERGYWTISSSEELTALGITNNQIAVPGFAFPVLSTRGDLAYFQYRADIPYITKRKYDSPRDTRLRLDVHPRSRPLLPVPGTPLFVTEGVKKADALVTALSGLSNGHAPVARSEAPGDANESHEGQHTPEGVSPPSGAVVGLPGGVWGWRGTNESGGKTTLPDWDDVALNGRHTYLVFDSDLATNRHVRAALDRLTGVLSQREAKVWWIFLPPGEDGAKVGADDYLLDHTIDDLIALARTASEVLAEDPLLSFPTTDLGAAERFAYMHEGRVLWNVSASRWHVWDGRRWNGDPTLTPARLAAETARATRDRAAAMTSGPRRDLLTAFARRLEGGQPLETMVRVARQMLETRQDAFDRDPWALTCLNGTVDLRTGELRPHDPEDRITYLSPVVYDPDARLDEWEAFVARTCAGRDGMAEFLQQATGYSATGDTREEKLFMAIGEGRSGKSTFISTVAAALGDYAKTATFSTFLRQRDEGSADGSTSSLARLNGARLVSSIEVEDGKALAVALVKQLTGGDTVLARFLYQEHFEFVPTMKLWLVANHEPRVSKEEDAAWERIIRIPFGNVVPVEERDPELKGRLQDPVYAGPAVLAWIVRGCLAWQRTGRLVVPTSIMAETAAYRERMDVLSDFIEDECVVHEGARVGVADLFRRYNEWAKQNGERYPLKRTKFREALMKRGLDSGQQSGGGARTWQGIGLLTRFGSHEEDEINSGSFRP